MEPFFAERTLKVAWGSIEVHRNHTGRTARTSRVSSWQDRRIQLCPSSRATCRHSTQRWRRATRTKTLPTPF